MLFRVLVVVLVIAPIAHGSIFMSCDGEKQPVSIRIDNCNDEYCAVKRNVLSKLELTFRTDFEATDLRAIVRAYELGRWTQLPLGDLSKVCENLQNAKCPVPANTVAKFTFAITIPSFSLPGTKVIGEFKIVDQNGKCVACIRIPVRVVA